jgi:hypothetical protein
VIPCEHDVVPVLAGHVAFAAFACFDFALDVVVPDVYVSGCAEFAKVAAFECDLSAGFEALVSGV